MDVVDPDVPAEDVHDLRGDREEGQRQSVSGIQKRRGAAGESTLRKTAGQGSSRCTASLLPSWFAGVNNAIRFEASGCDGSVSGGYLVPFDIPNDRREI